MKLITAVIRPEKFEAVKNALFAAQVTGMTTFSVAGHGGELEGFESCCGQGFHEKIQFEIAVSEPYVQITLDAIMQGARTGAVGDGKIFVRPLDRVLRIRTGEVDLDALTPDPMRFPGILESMVPGC
jgi:nitrogen regulatory protein P-II 1